MMPPSLSLVLLLSLLCFTGTDGVSLLVGFLVIYEKNRKKIVPEASASTVWCSALTNFSTIIATY